MEQEKRRSGIDIVGEVPWGTHLCMFYETLNDLAEILVPYFKTGLENNEFCLWVCWEPLLREKAIVEIGKEVGDLEAYISKGQIEIVDYIKRYTAQGKSGFNEMVEFWIDKERLAFERGFQGLRLAGNTYWLERGEWQDFMRYEREVDEVIRSHQMIAICPYSLDRCSAVDILDVMSSHRFALIRKEGKWSIIRSLEEERLQTALVTQMQNFRNSLDNSPSGIRVVTAKGELLYANKAILDIYGYSSFEELRDTPTKQRYTPESYAEHVERREKREREEYVPESYEISIIRKDGEVRLLDVFRRGVLWNGEKQFQAIYQDVTERRKAERSLAAEKERLEVTLRSTGDGVITTDMEGKVVLMNRVAEALTGWTSKEAEGKLLGEAFHIIDERTRQRISDPVARVLKTGRIVGLINHAVLISRDGTEYIIADSGAPIHDESGNLYGVVLVFRDVTHIRRLEEELEKADKLESLGVLAGGIAHDFNNLLTGIMGNISLAIRRAEHGGDFLERLVEAEKASFRAKDLTQQLLTFARGGAPIKKLAAISSIVRDSATFALRGSNVLCQFSLPDDLWPVEIDEGQISQVLTKVVINADEAMPEGGTVKITAENTVIRAKRDLPLPRGKYLRISIKDTGIGIPEEHAKKLFEPYFTTKQKGRGLGLATAYSIIKKHGGHITASSKLGKGTTFDIYLPASKRPPPAEEKALAVAPIVGTGKTLVMDDEEVVRNFLYEELTDVGCDVELTNDGKEAIKRYAEAKEAGQPFDAVILDLTVPGGVGGRKAIKKLLEIDPNVKAIVSSGYSADPIMSNYKEYGFSAVVAKPYNVAELEKTLQGLLRRKK
jgi:PAS domain S-box-containing protein